MFCEGVDIALRPISLGVREQMSVHHDKHIIANPNPGDKHAFPEKPI
ncbi:MAG: hypothetical protein ACREN8_11870 [Candidatus Dormibacteraceae bacterium]